MEPESKNSTGDDELHETYSESLLMRSWSESTSSSFVRTADCLHNNTSGALETNLTLEGS